MAAVARSSSPPPTAAVLEYMCLFTHDLRRKQKRWQDGRLKYHTFNKRVMVHDERGNFVGDMHWRHDCDLEEGEEIELERGGIIVQVSSLVARRETDLSELLDKRAKEKEQRQVRQIARSPAPTAVLPRSMPRTSVIPPDHFQLRHRSLHQVIGTPTGHHGRALVPNESPFEQRHQAVAAAPIPAPGVAAESPDERAAKRRRHDNLPPSKSGYATSLFGQSLTLSATPSSSVSTKRRPRPEINSVASAQADLADAEEEARPIQREKPRISRNLNQKTGYAQGLFGQSLTLSHKPVSSVPPRSQPRHELNSSSIPDVEIRDGQSEPQIGLQEQPIVSHHFNQSISKPQSVRSGEDHNANRKTGKTSSDLADGNVSHRQPKENRNISRDRPVNKHWRPTTAPADDDIIEIDDPEVVPIQAARPLRQEKVTRQTARPNQHTNDGPNVTASRHTIGREESVSSHPAEQGNEQESESEKTQDSVQSRKSKAVASKSATSRRAANDAVSDTSQDASHSFATSRRPNEPVTELRIKSRKRGLLMISDAAKKPRRLATENSARSSDRGFQPSTNQSDGDIAGSPLLNRDTVSDDEETENDTRRMRVQRTWSLGFEKPDDPFQPLPPEHLERSMRDGKASTKDGSSQPSQPITEALHGPSSDSPLDDVDIDGEDATIDEATTRPSPVPNGDHNPYRIPSSPEEEVPFSWPASSPRRKSPPIDNGSKEPHTDAVRKAREVEKRYNTATKTKHQRPSRRKVILEDDDESVLLDRTLDIFNDTEDDDTEMHEVASTKQSKPNKAAKANSKKSRSVVDLGLTDEDSIQAVKPKSNKQCGHSGPELQDEQPGKRRRSTRQRRNRLNESEEPHLVSEEDVSEEEQAPKKRQCRIPKTSDNRPRLERIKKNVKSRELVGFNLAALNAPLGLRGIGMPFKILSSPVDESIQRRVANEDVTETSSDSLLDDGDEQTSSAALSTHSTTPESDRIVVDEAISTALGEYSTTPTLYLLAADNQGYDNTRVDQTEVVITDAATNKRHAFSAGPTGPADSADHPAARGTTPSSRKEQSKVAEDTTPETKAQVAIESTESTHTDPAPDVAVAAPVGRLQTPAINLQRRPSIIEPVNDAGPRTEQSRTGTTRSSGCNESPAAAASAAATATVAAGEQVLFSAPARKSTHAIQQQHLTTAQEEDAEAEAAHKNLGTADDTETRLTAGSATRSRVSAPFRKPTPTIRKQSSMTTSVNGVRADLPKGGLDTTRDNETTSTHVSAAPITVDEPLQTSTLARPSSSGGIDTGGRPNPAGQNVEREQPLPGCNQRHKPIGLRRQTSAPQRVNNITAVPPQAGASAGQTADDSAKPVARIVNPASRGRKAALASDAVGQVPQRVLPPTQPALLVPVSTADLACTPYEPPPKEPERPKKKMTFPGFQSAKGVGPWSREAFDLLETGRPE